MSTDTNHDNDNNHNNDDNLTFDSFDEFEQGLNKNVQELKKELLEEKIKVEPIITKKIDETKESSDSDVAEDPLLETLQKLIYNFLINWKDGYYKQKIMRIKQEQLESITIDYNDLMHYNNQLTEFIDTSPQNAISLMKQVLYKIDKEFELEYFDSKKYFGIRFENYPFEEQIREVDVRKINTLRVVRGFVSKTSDKKPYIYKYYLRCPDCGTIEYLDYIKEDCTNKKCEKKPRMRNNPNLNIYTNVMFIKIQELAEDSITQVPQSIDCMVFGDLINEIEAGQKIICTGFVMLREIKSAISKKTPYIISLMANNIQKFTSNDLNLIQKIYLTPKDEAKFDELSKQDNFVDMIIDSIAPQVYGMREVKLGIALAITGSGKVVVDGEEFRDRINILLCTDPGKAKSKLLRFIKRIVLGSVLATGKGSSGGGLTALTLREPDGSFSVVPGSLVFANKSIFMFDEADKVTDEVRSHLHESMEDGTITLNKGGQAVVLQALATTIFAANPKHSRYQDDLSLAENINLPHSLISRFDIVYVIKDSTEHDKEITDHINYMYANRSVPNSSSLFSTEDLIKLFLYIKKRDIDPEIPDHIYQKFQDYYYKLRSQSTSETIATTVRQYEGALRKVRARCRMNLRDTVTDKMADEIIKLDQTQIDTIGREPDGTLNVNYALGKSRKEIGDTKFITKVMESLEPEYGKHKIPINKLKDLLIDKHDMTDKEADKLIKKMQSEATIIQNGENYVRLAKYA